MRGLVVSILAFAFTGASLAAVPVEQRDIGTVYKRQSTAQADPMWELVNQLQMLQTEVFELRGLVEQQAYEIEQLQQQQKKHYVDLDQRIEALRGGSQVKASLPGAQSQKQAEPVDSKEVKARYQQALSLIKDREYQAASDRLEQILASGESFYTPFAHYWLAEVLLAKNTPDLLRAEKAFKIVVDEYPSHSKVPPSLYKLGTIYHSKGDVKKAREILRTLMSQHSGSSEAGMASHYLEQISGP